MYTSYALRRELEVRFERLDSFAKSSYSPTVGREAWEEYSCGLLSLIRPFIWVHGQWLKMFCRLVVACV